MSTIGNQIQRKLCKVKVAEENQDIYKKAEEKAKEKYEYPEIFEYKDIEIYRFTKGSEELYQKILKGLGKILKNSNSNSDFQEKRQKIEKDYMVFKSKLYMKRLSYSPTTVEAGILNKVINELNDERKNKTGKIADLLSLEKRSIWGRVFQGIESFVPKFLEKIILDFYLRDKNIILTDQDLDREMDIILKNKETALIRVGSKQKPSAAEMIME